MSEPEPRKRRGADQIVGGLVGGAALGAAGGAALTTSFRDDERGYVSVGFPLPDANFTATLLPENLEDRLVLTSRSELPFPGHYLSAVERETGELTVLKLLYFHERIEVYVDGDQLKTDHRFYLAGQDFLLLDYTIDRAEAPG